jgi:hypothetical protein
MACGCLCGTMAGCARDRALGDEVATREPRPARVVQSLSSEYELVPGPLRLVFGPRRRAGEGQLQLVRGRLWLDASALGLTRARLTFDLSSIVVDDAARPEAPAILQSGGSLTEQSLDWLGLRDPAQLEAFPERRYAHFEVSSFAAEGSADAREGEVVPASPGVRARRVRGRATGDLELHGFRLPYTVRMAVTFSWLEPSPLEGPPGRVELTVAEPISVELLRHEVVPRTARGEIRADALAELRKLPSNTVQASGRWLAELSEQDPRP